MLRPPLRRLAGFALFALPAALHAQPAPRTLVLINVHVIDGTGAAPQRDVQVVSTGERLVHIGAGPVRVSAPADTIDAGGRWLVPGLIDAHTHISTRAAMQRALGSGVTTVRSSSTSHYQDVGLRELVKVGTLIGPEMLAAGVFVTPYLGETATADPRLAALGDAVLTASQLREVVRINASRGVDVIKTRGTERAGLEEQDPRKQVYDTEQLRAIVEEATVHGLKVQVHAHGDEGARAAVLAGAHSIEHGTYLTDSTLALMKQRGTYLVPTYATVIDLTLPGGEYDSPLLQLRGRHMLPRLRETVQRAHSLGVPIVTGGDTNYGADGVTRIAHEVEHFVELGLTPMQALQSATAVAAKALGIADRTGTLTVGREADYALVERNPLEDIRALQDVLLVVANGRVAVKRIPFALPAR